MQALQGTPTIIAVEDEGERRGSLREDKVHLASRCEYTREAVKSRLVEARKNISPFVAFIPPESQLG
jgi:hypothetical protein